MIKKEHHHTLAYTLLLASFLLLSCAPLNKRQLTAVSTFSQSVDSFSCTPLKVYQALAESRLQRGLFFTVTLSDPSMRVQELDRLMSAQKKDIQLSKKADIAFETISQYMRALKFLSSENRVTGVPLEIRTMGRKMDSLLMVYNELGDVRPVQTGYATLFGKFIAKGTEWTLQYAQAKHVKKLIVAGDTLIASLMNVLVETLMNEDLNTQIKHERTMLRQSYESYLKSGVDAHAIEQDERYLRLATRLEQIQELRLKSAQTARSIRNAHRKLLTTCLQTSSWKEDYEWLLLAGTQMKAVQSDWKKLETLMR